MEDNPFLSMVKTIKQVSKSQIPTNFRFGTVVTSDPLQLDVAGTIQDKDSVLKNSTINTFTEGDILLLIPIEEEQRYIILCKVVSI